MVLIIVVFTQEETRAVGAMKKCVVQSECGRARLKNTLTVQLMLCPRRQNVRSPFVRQTGSDSFRRHADNAPSLSDRLGNMCANPVTLPVEACCKTQFSAWSIASF